jgi:hypothetical protein
MFVCFAFDIFSIKLDLFQATCSIILVGRRQNVSRQNVGRQNDALPDLEVTKFEGQKNSLST